MAAPMKLAALFSLTLFLGIFAIDDEFHEELLLKPLPSGHLYSHFQFSTTWNIELGNNEAFQHYHLFPKALGEVLAKYRVQELHLSLTQGLWRLEKWGYPVVDSPPGAQLWVWFQDSVKDVDSTWTDLVNVLSGMFCASLNFMDAKSTVVPKLSFRPMGATSKIYDNRHGKMVRYAALARENVCTENLTPWKKLLPCKGGLASLFVPAKTYDTNYHSLGIHFRPVCQDPSCNTTSVELSQTLSLVFEPPITVQVNRQDWTFKKLFGRFLSATCPLAKSSSVLVDVTSNKTLEYYFTLDPKPSEIVQRGRTATRYAMYHIGDFVQTGRYFNLAAKYNREVMYSPVKPPVIHAHTFQTGYGQEKGGVMSLIYNRHPADDLTVVVMQTLPWFLRVYLHTLRIENFKDATAHIGVNGTGIKPSKLHYVPGQDRQRSYHLELILLLPADSITRISFDFDRALLKWTEYPPDANHGFYVNSAVVSTVIPDSDHVTAPPRASSQLATLMSDESERFFVRMYTESLLVILPTPDFSMPYNVICLACTVVAIAFGSFHNLTTRRFIVRDATKSTGMLAKLKEKLWRKKKDTTQEAESEKVVETSADAKESADTGDGGGGESSQSTVEDIKSAQKS